MRKKAERAEDFRWWDDAALMIYPIRISGVRGMCYTVEVGSRTMTDVPEFFTDLKLMSPL